MLMDLPNRKQNRLDNFDYSQNGMYFITVCTQNRKCIFEIEPSNVGNDQCVVPQKDSDENSCLQNQIIHKWIKITEKKFPNIKFDKYVIMPDHLHIIIELTGDPVQCYETDRPDLYEIIGAYKSLTTRICNRRFNTSGAKLFQTSFYESVIRSEQGYYEAYQYIEGNPARWLEKYSC